MAVSRIESVPVCVEEEEPSRAAYFAAALDLQTVGDGDNRWVVHVVGVHTDGRTLWVQIAPRPDGTDSVILKLSMWATARHALAALAALPSARRDYPQIVPVMCHV
jgi:hypothetical protein